MLVKYTWFLSYCQPANTSPDPVFAEFPPKLLRPLPCPPVASPLRCIGAPAANTDPEAPTAGSPQSVLSPFRITGSPFTKTVLCPAA